ncbi:hypothetical protein [Aureimonas sp. AU4]|uniref:hypothetical protein n=1 Tax=Aureimonas sp. AU4 TaxID=1638163 RepID=UPI000781D081|nr:hypothetical protein [Aureimonas sp. AU4]
MGVNDIAQQYPSASTSGATALANFKTAIDAARTKGFEAWVVLDAGANNMSSAQIAQLDILNQGLRDYATGKKIVSIFDLATVLWDTKTSSAITFESGYVAPETPQVHEAEEGAYYAGKAFAAFLLARGLTPLSRTDGMPLSVNPTFVGNVGIKPTGITGDLATSWAARAVARPRQSERSPTTSRCSTSRSRRLASRLA